MIDWVLGPGEAYLSTSRDIGDSVITCEILRKEHEEFELNARVRKHSSSLPPSTAEVSTVKFGEPSIYVLYKNFSRSCHLRRNVSCLRHPGVAWAQPWRPTCFPPSTYPLITHILHYIRRLTYPVPFIHSRRWSTTSLRCESWPRRCSKRTIMHQKTSKPRRNFWTEAVGALPCAWTGEEISFWRHSSSTRVLGRWGSLYLRMREDP